MLFACTVMSTEPVFAARSITIVPLVLTLAALRFDRLREAPTARHVEAAAVLVGLGLTTYALFDTGWLDPNHIPAFYYLPPNATKPIQMLTDVAFPNGVVLSRDEKILYLNNTNGEYMIAFDVQPDGSLKNRRNFAKYEGVTPNAAGVPVSGADGLTIDGAGRLYAACANGVQVFSPQGQHLTGVPVRRVRLGMQVVAVVPADAAQGRRARPGRGRPEG